MRVGILTRRAGFNHGSSLQAYAMARFLTNAGYDCLIIDYDEYSGHPLWRVRPLIENIQWKISKKLPACLRSARYKYLSVRSCQYKRFREFEQGYLPLTSRAYSSPNQLNKICKEFDVLVCGSDQIWSPLLYDPVYLFGFLEDENKIHTVAYAPSIGVSDKSLIGEEEANLMKRIGCISCRERQGSAVIEEITHRSVPVVLDPTLMVPCQDWDKLASTTQLIEAEPYILCYFLGKNIPQSYIDKLSGKLGCKILNIQMFNRLNSLESHRELTDVGPCEFLNLVKNATWVCTDSFHATIFSYIFQRKMSVFERFKYTERDNQNSRIYTLLDILKCQNVLTNCADIPNLKQDINFDKNEQSLNMWKDTSMDFINKSLCTVFV